jgi:phosphocarrier protein HPr
MCPLSVREVTIINRLGMHARPAMQFVETANRFHCSVTVSKGDKKVNGKSIMEMMLLEAMPGTVLQLDAEGGDADACLDALAQLVLEKFHEK